MPIIPLPKKVSYDVENDFTATLIIEPLFPGYGTTIGNVLRRVLLSSLSGVAIKSIKVHGVDHEFTSIKHVKEDMVEVVLNLKKIRVKSNTELTDEVVARIHATGERDVTAGDIEISSEIEIVNPELKIATLTDPAAELSMDLNFAQGCGYQQIEMQENFNTEVGIIAIDTQFSPVVSVGMETKNVRVDKMTNYDSLTLKVTTDRTRTPEQAVSEALHIILEQLNFIQTEHTENNLSDEAHKEEENEEGEEQ